MSAKAAADGSIGLASPAEESKISFKDNPGLVSLFEKLRLTFGTMKSIEACTCVRSAGGNGFDCAYCVEVFQPPQMPECQLCCMPLQFEGSLGMYLTCCGNRICTSCVCMEDLNMADPDGVHEGVLGERRKMPVRCPFCRALCDVTEEENGRRVTRRMEANDPEAYSYAGNTAAIDGDIVKALEMNLKAVELGGLGAFAVRVTCHLWWLMTFLEEGSNEYAEIKVMTEKCQVVGAGQGYLESHHHLGLAWKFDGNHSLAYKHICFAAEHGHIASSRLLLEGYVGGYITKEKYAATLRAHKAAYDAAMSPERQLAIKIMKPGVPKKKTDGMIKRTKETLKIEH